MSAGDGIAVLGVSIAAAAMLWTYAWAAVRMAAIRDEALRRLGEPTWTAKTGSAGSTRATRRSA